MAMSTFPLSKEVPVTAAHSHPDDAQMVGRIRLLLALSALVAVVIDPMGESRTHGVALVLLSCYVLACLAAYVCAQYQLRFALGRFMHRFDVAVAFALFTVGGRVDIVPFIVLFFAILVASLRWGFEEGARVTVVSVILYGGGAVATVPGVAPPQLLSGAAVLLALGYVIAFLGERNIQLARRLDLLRGLNQTSNPRFGVDRSMTAALQSTRAFFAAERCIVLLEEDQTGQYYFRCVRQDGPSAAAADTVNAQLAEALLPQPRTHILVYRCPWRHWRLLAGTSLSHAGEPGSWRKHGGAQWQAIADLLDAGSFISAPLVLGRGKGRIYVTARGRRLGRSDALFLAQIVTQGLRVIDRIDLLDRIASDAASLERKRFALDLHDTAIQPYVGLKLGLAALRKKADPANPLVGDIEKLLAVADDVIGQLRDYARGVGSAPGPQVPVCLSALQLQSEQTMASSGVDISIEVQGQIEFGDRLTAEVLQIVREGLSNICRHTAAKRGAVLLRCSDILLRIDISNDNGGVAPPAFVPRSISARAAALGGAAFVRQGTIGSTIVCVEIPV